MEFLVISNPNTTNMGLEELKNVRDGINQFKNDKRTKALYGFAGREGGVMICEVETAGELDEYLNLNPISAIREYEIVPLATVEERNALLDKIERHFEAEKAA